MKLDFVEIGERAGFRLLHLALLVAFFPNFRVRRAHLARAHDSDPRRCQLEQCPSIERSRGRADFDLSELSELKSLMVLLPMPVSKPQDRLAIHITNFPHPEL